MATHEEYCRRRGIPYTPPEPAPAAEVVVEEAKPEKAAPKKKPAPKKAPAKKKTSASKSKAKAKA